MALVRHIRLRAATSEADEERLVQAAQDAVTIRHPHVLRLLEVVARPHALDLVYEYVDSQPLQSLMLRASIRRTLFPIGVALRVIVDTLAGLEAAQRTAAELHGGGFGGVSPESILVTRDGSGLLCDALVASAAAGLEEFGKSPAKLAYAAPEQVGNAGAIGAQADVFACTVTLWELLAARRFLLGPRATIERRLREHQLPDLKQVLKTDRSVSAALLKIVGRALSADPQARQRAPGELRKDLLGCGHEVADAAQVAQYFAELSAGKERRFDDVSQPLSHVPAPPNPDSSQAPALEAGPPQSDPLSFQENTPAYNRPSVAPALDKVAAWLDKDETTQDWTSRSSTFRPLGPLRPSAPPAPPRPVGPSAPVPGQSNAEPPSPPSSQAGASRANANESVGVPLASLQAKPPPAPEAPREPAVTPRQTKVISKGPPPPPLPPASARQSPPGRPSRFAQTVPPRQGSPPPLELGGVLTPPEPLPADAPMAISPFALSQSAPPPVAAAGWSIPPEQLKSRVSRTTHPARSKPFSSMPASPRTEQGAAVDHHEELRGRAGVLSNPRARIALASLLGVLLVGAGALLWSRRSATPAHAPSADTARDAPKAAVIPPTPAPVEPSEPATITDAGPAHEESAAGKTAEASEVTAPGALAPAAADVGASLFSKTLADEQLQVLFTLESSSTLPSCSQRTAAAPKTRSKVPLRALLKNARKALVKGQHERAHDMMCEVSRRGHGARPLQRDLAELALRLGDWDEARQSAERALGRARSDRVLLTLWGDALAQGRNIEQARRAWLSTAGKGDDARRAQRLAGTFNKLGRRALKSGAYFDASRYFRRALILTQGGIAPSVGFGEALLALGESRAALAWAERAARGSPKDGRIQLLLGDALYENGKQEPARQAWSTALALRPKDAQARRRLATGQR